MNIKKIKGRVLYVSGDNLYLAKGYKIYKSTNNGNTWEIWNTLQISLINKLFMSIPLFARLLRKEIHHIIIYDDIGIIIANKESYIIQDKTTTKIERLHGSRPMVLCKTKENDIFYGEYRSNPNRNKVNIWKLNKSKLIWESVWNFDGIRHVHGVFYDEYTNTIWITTGDKDTEAGIWCTKDNFKSLDKIAGGSQQLRTVQLIFSKDYVYFGSDAPNEINYIYRMNRNGSDIQQLTKVGSSVFYGCKVKNSYFFSTAVEPSSCNKTRYVEIWRSENGKEWYLYRKIKKDMWSMKYFQYGQIFFPGSYGNNSYLYFSPYATDNSGYTFLDDISSQAFS